VYYIFNKFCVALLAIYRLCINLKIIKYHTFSVPVVSVGNIALGGTGKTPFVYYLAKLLTRENIRHAVVSRGYKKTLRGTCVVHNGEKRLFSSPAGCGDEPFMLSCKLKKTPIVSDNKKARGIRFAIQHFSPQVILLDDGFQSHYLDKKLEIVLINTLDTNRDLKIFPFGRLRENVDSLKRADLIVFTKQNLRPVEKSGAVAALPVIKSLGVPYMSSNIIVSLKQYSLNGVKPYCWNNSMVRVLPKQQKLFSFCGIGDPASFEQTARSYKKNVIKHVVFKDHYNYQQNEVQLLKICQALYSESQITGILTTQKDFVKIKNLSGPFLAWCYHAGLIFFILDIELKVVEESLILERIKSLTL